VDTAGLGCDGDTIAMTAATQPSIEDVVGGALPWIPKGQVTESILSFENGDDFLARFRLSGQVYAVYESTAGIAFVFDSSADLRTDRSDEIHVVPVVVSADGNLNRPIQAIVANIFRKRDTSTILATMCGPSQIKCVAVSPVISSS
jgi:hypothetical protein